MALDQPMDDAKVNANGGIKHASPVRMGPYKDALT